MVTISKEFLFKGTPHQLALCAVTFGTRLLNENPLVLETHPHPELPYMILPKTFGADKDADSIIIELVINNPNPLMKGELTAIKDNERTWVSGTFQSEDWELFRERYESLYNELVRLGRIESPVGAQDTPTESATMSVLDQDATVLSFGGLGMPGFKTMTVIAELDVVRNEIRKCIRDGIITKLTYSEFHQPITLDEYIEFETPLRSVWGITVSAIEATYLTTQKTELRLLPVMKIYHDQEEYGVWKTLRQYFRQLELNDELETLPTPDDFLSVRDSVTIEKILRESAPPELGDEQDFKNTRREFYKTTKVHNRLQLDAESGRFYTAEEIEIKVKEDWKGEQEYNKASQARYNEIHSFDEMTLKEATKRYLMQNSLIESTEKQKAESKYWEMIEDHLWDRQALELWHRGYTCKEIFDQTHVASEDRIRNRLTELRNKYGEEVVPTDEQRRKSKIVIPRDSV
jgi:hypothetical protein